MISIMSYNPTSLYVPRCFLRSLPRSGAGQGSPCSVCCCCRWFCTWVLGLMALATITVVSVLCSPQCKPGSVPHFHRNIQRRRLSRRPFPGRQGMAMELLQHCCRLLPQQLTGFCPLSVDEASSRRLLGGLCVSSFPLI